MPISKLLNVSPPPVHPIDAEGDWGTIEKQIGMKLPVDYRQIIEKYGRGSFADFLHFIDPFPDADNFLARVEDMFLEHEREMRSMFPEDFLFPVYPDAGGLFPWATTDNGDTLFWLTAGEPESWQVVVRESRGGRHVVYPFGAAEFLQRWLSGKLECPIFPERHEYFDPGFTVPRPLEVVTSYFGYVEAPFDERLKVLMNFLGSKKINHRHVTQCGFTADPSDSRMTYTDIGTYGSWLSISFPQGDESYFKTMIGRIPHQLGWPIRFVLRNGQQIWLEIPQGEDPRSIK